MRSLNEKSAAEVGALRFHTRRGTERGIYMILFKKVFSYFGFLVIFLYMSIWVIGIQKDILSARASLAFMLVGVALTIFLCIANFVLYIIKQEDQNEKKENEWKTFLFLIVVFSTFVRIYYYGNDLIALINKIVILFYLIAMLFINRLFRSNKDEDQEIGNI